ncbi:trypsin-like peptidase domain-containing protein [Candidatus Bathyarchaeota archaeon]|nr:trypsin-like peptidase domain-containing protein [Candidatus Bathyarchaeota archaeon]MBS7627222.1 trypsin-like peptidase domain-containing protein [Candidatus Bathyarchaeota archaeon]
MVSLDDRIIKAVEKVAPSVVNISTVHIVQDYFFHAQPVQGMGSGFIIDPKGYLVSNSHVVMGSSKVTVTMADGRRLPGIIVGVDRNRDVALIKVEEEGLKTVELGDSDGLRVGQIVVAIGNPFGFFLGGGPTVTLGLVSALNRHIAAGERIFENLIQTDAAINPGNSGGPLVNLNGEVVGINTAMIPYAQGIGFAIPINDAKRSVKDLMSFGRIRRPWLGLIGVTLTPGLADQLGIPAMNGVLIVRVLPFGPAHKAGIEEGDIILRLGEDETKSIEDLRKYLETAEVGERISILLFRDGRKELTALKLEEAPR